MTKKRYSVLAMVFVTVVINYLDRTNISIAASALQSELNMDSLQLGYIFRPLHGPMPFFRFREALWPID